MSEEVVVLLRLWCTPCTCTERWRQGARQQMSCGSRHGRCPNRSRRACVCIRMSELIFHNPNNSVWNSVEQKKMATRLNNHDLHVRYVTPMRSFQVVLVNLLLGINPFPLQIWWWFLVPGALWGTRTLGSLGFCWGHRIIAVRKDVPVE